MADILLYKIVNNQIDLKSFISWLLESNNAQETDFNEINHCNCSKTEFITYFLNYIHEEIPSNERYGETPQKTNTPKRIELQQTAESGPKLVKRRSSLFGGSDKKANDQKFEFKKSQSSTTIYNKSLNSSENCVDISNLSSCSASTPKVLRVNLDGSGLNHNTSYMSPISPLYKNSTSFSTPKYKKHNKSLEKVSPLCLGDFITSKKGLAKKRVQKSIVLEECDNINDDKVTTKRINPTNLNQKKVNTYFRKGENSFNFQNSFEEISTESKNEQRSFLAEERMKLLIRKSSGDNLNTSTPKKLHSLINLRPEIEADINQVTLEKELNYIIQIYKNILNHNLVLNITSEIYFLISLLLQKQYSIKDKSDQSSFGENFGVGVLNQENSQELLSIVENINQKTVEASEIFDTVHNIVYFASKSLQYQTEIIKHYDKSTLKLLSENRRLKMFSPEFAQNLQQISEKKSERIVEVFENNIQTNVCFDIDTDNRDNFPNDHSFHTFKKQRDLFYEILRVWESNHLVPGWSFTLGLSGKLKTLLSLYNEPTNFMHLARLFKDQLLHSCLKSNREEGLSENELPLLSSFPNVNAEKLSRLKNRLVTKEASSGIKSVPIFSGHQEFYKEFIVVASSSYFNKHLCDIFIAEILELNDTKFNCTEFESNETDVEPATRKMYTSCIHSLRILAKFLGFVESLPYKSDCNSYSEHILSSFIKIRQLSNPLFDVKKILIKSKEERNLILTIPWITKYLSMLDYLTLRLPYYTSLHKILFEIYQDTSSKKKKNSYNSSLIKFSLGWLFELPHFPDQEYYTFCIKKNEENTCDSEEIYTNTQSGLDASQIKSNEEVARDFALDDIKIIDQKILYICCPYLGEIKTLLNANASSSAVTVKHITPVTAVQSSHEIAQKKLEQQLEEAFFNGQPVSLRKTVEFVTERVASTCVKHICSNVVPAFKKSSLDELKTYLASCDVEYKSLTSDKLLKAYRSSLKKKCNEISQINLRKLLELCESETESIIKEKIPVSITSLLSLDVLQQTKDVCVSISTKICLERVRQWIQSHVTISIFTKEFDGEYTGFTMGNKKNVKDKPVFAMPPGGDDGKKHNEDVISAAHLLDKIKQLNSNILEGSVEVTEKMVLQILNEAHQTLTKRNDVNQSIESYIYAVIVDLSLLLITFHTQIMTTSAVLLKLSSVWRLYYGNCDGFFKNIVCPRNIMILAQSRDVKKSWETLANFVVYLIQQDLLKCDTFESQCTAVFRRNWDEETIANLSHFLKTFVNSYTSSGDANVSKFLLLLEFLSEFCTDL